MPRVASRVQMFWGAPKSIVKRRIHASGNLPMKRVALTKPGKQARRTAVGKSSKSNFYSQSQLQAYGWRACFVEFLCGMVAIAWYLLFLAERAMLRGLTQLEEIAAARPDHVSGIGRGSNALFQDEGSYSELRNAADHDSPGSDLRSF